MMDSDDDDIYPENDTAEYQPPSAEVKMDDMDEEEEGEEVEDDDDSDVSSIQQYAGPPNADTLQDEINFITDIKEAPKTDISSSTTTSQAKRAAGSSNETRAVSISTPVPNLKREATPQPSSLPDIKSELTESRPGSSYPARHTSTLDPQNGNPVLPAAGKPLLSVDLDTDFGDDDKPWRKPGVDLTDYFNYGFDEFTWASYCLNKTKKQEEIKGITDNAEQMKNFLEGMGGFPGAGMPGMPGMPGMGGQPPAVGGVSGGQPNPANAAVGGGAEATAGGGMPMMPGMPSEADMQQMFQGMMAQGMDPSQMDQNHFMQMMMGGAGGGQPGGGTGAFGGQQPPSGPAMGGFNAGFDQGSGGFGGRGRGRRGRGNW